MLGQTSFGGITSTGQSTAQAVTTSAAQLVIAGGSALPTTADRSGIPSVKADPTNNRLLLNAPGIYRIALQVIGAAASALQTTFQVRKNGSSGTTLTPTSKQTWGTTPATHSAEFYVEITQSDVLAATAVQTFSNPDATAGVGKPAGGFAGAGAAPATGVPVDIMVTGDGSVNLTPTDIRLFAERIG